MKTTFLSAVALLAASAPAFCAPAHPGAVRAPASAGSVTLRASTDAARYTPGQTIKVGLLAANTSRRNAVLNFSSGQRFDFSVYKIGSREPSYTWSAPLLFAQVTGRLALRPGQTQAYDAQIGTEMGTLPAGRYRLLAKLTNSPRPVAAAPISFEIVDSGLSVTARTDKSTYKLGEEVRIDIDAVNRLSRANTQKFSSGQTFDVFITDEFGKPVWNDSANKRFLMVQGPITWQPREKKSYSTTWNGSALPGEVGEAPLKPGRYRVQAVLSSTPNVLAAPIEIEITS